MTKMSNINRIILILDIIILLYNMIYKQKPITSLNEQITRMFVIYDTQIRCIY